MTKENYKIQTETTTIIDKDGNELYAIDNGKQVYSGGAASEMVDIMKGVITYRTRIH